MGSILFERTAKMKKTYPWVMYGKRACFADLAILDELEEQAGSDLCKVLDDGYGLSGTISRIKVELMRQLEKAPSSAELMTAHFTAFGQEVYLDAEAEKIYVYDEEGRQKYVLVRPYAAKLSVYGRFREALCAVIIGRWETGLSRGPVEATIGEAIAFVPSILTKAGKEVS